MRTAHVGDRVTMSAPGWEALDGHNGVVASMQVGPFPYMVRCDDGAFRRYRAEEVRLIGPRLNGVRVRFVAPRRDQGLPRWVPVDTSPNRVRTCRGRRR